MRQRRDISYARNLRKLLRSLEKICPRQLQAVLEQDECQIDPTFLGFIDTYYHLAQLIPTTWSVIDFGCAYAPQAYYFRQHRSYVGVDSNNYTRFWFANTRHESCSIADYLATQPPTAACFAICNYVPSKEVTLVREYYPNVYVYYPEATKGSASFPIRLRKV